MTNPDRSCLWLTGFAHFTVDFACTALLASLSHRVSMLQLTAYAILYNGLAFAFQLPVGAFGDLKDLKRLLAGAGCLLVAAGSLFSAPVVMCLLIGLGNACFHVGGGREVLQRSGGNPAAVGKFVAPGAVGIFFGPRLSAISWLTHALLPGTLVLMGVWLLISRRQDGTQQAISPLPLSRGRLAGVIGCMFFTVLLRSYMGTVLAYPFLSKASLAFLFTVSIFLGKFLGGVLSQRFGLLPFAAAGQVSAAILFVLSVRLPVLAYPAIFLFNTTMAVTATQLYRCLPQYPGTMFGLTTFALYLGVLPRLLGWKAIPFAGWSLGLMGLISTVLLLAGLMLLTGGERRAADASVPGALSGCDAAP